MEEGCSTGLQLGHRLSISTAATGGNRHSGPHEAMFVPPHPDRVVPALEDLARFMARDDLPALVQAAVAHAQFETIHPFPDGNGRSAV